MILRGVVRGREEEEVVKVEGVEEVEEEGVEEVEEVEEEGVEEVEEVEEEGVEEVEEEVEELEEDGGGDLQETSRTPSEPLQETTSGPLQETSRRPSGDHFRSTPGHRRYPLHPLSVSTMAQSIVPLVIVLLASSLALSNAIGKADGLYANPLNSHTFYQCSNSLTYLKSCPSTLVFNPAICVCDWPEYVVDFCKAKVDGMFADPGNSNAFYHCSNHYTYYKLCQQGLVFNQRLGACVWPSQVTALRDLLQEAGLR
ncbi:unnamed protein product [Lampetra fluviatilis]